MIANTKPQVQLAFVWCCFVGLLLHCYTPQSNWHDPSGQHAEEAGCRHARARRGEGGVKRMQALLLVNMFIEPPGTLFQIIYGISAGP